MYMYLERVHISILVNRKILLLFHIKFQYFISSYNFTKMKFYANLKKRILLKNTIPFVKTASSWE